MAFEGGPIGVVGIKPQYLGKVSSAAAAAATVASTTPSSSRSSAASNTFDASPITSLATSAVSSSVPGIVGQVWKGSGQSFFGKAGQSLAGNLAGSAVNVALNSALGTQVVGPQGLKLDSGANVLASLVTPQVTSQVAAGINQQIQKSLQSAGPFGPLLSNVATGLVNQGVQALTDSIFGATDTSSNDKLFPGGGGEPAADYGGSAFSLEEVTFSLQPANQGPQAFGSNEIKLPKTITTLPFGDLTSMPPSAGSATANVLKDSSMVGGLAKKTFSTNLPSLF